MWSRRRHRRGCSHSLGTRTPADCSLRFRALRASVVGSLGLPERRPDRERIHVVVFLRRAVNSASRAAPLRSPSVWLNPITRSAAIVQRNFSNSHLRPPHCRLQHSAGTTTEWSRCYKSVTSPPNTGSYAPPRSLSRASASMLTPAPAWRLSARVAAERRPLPARSQGFIRAGQVESFLKELTWTRAPRSEPTRSDGTSSLSFRTQTDRSIPVTVLRGSSPARSTSSGWLRKPKRGIAPERCSRRSGCPTATHTGIRQISAGVSANESQLLERSLQNQN